MSTKFNKNMSQKQSTKQRAARFKATRKQHRLETAEDYTELIADLIKQKGEARTCDIAKLKGVSHVTAIRAIRRVKELGYLNSEPRKPITLTKKGKKLAEFCKKRHELVVSLFIKLGVPQDIAEKDAEGAEHHISSKTLDAIEKYVKS